MNRSGVHVCSWIQIFGFTPSSKATICKKLRLLNLIAEDSCVVVSVQVINEVCRNLIRRAKFTEVKIQTLVNSFYAKYSVIPFEQAMLRHASELRVKYRFAFWDGLIISAALAANADLLHSEDMQDGLVVEGRLRIQNPFLRSAKRS